MDIRAGHTSRHPDDFLASARRPGPATALAWAAVPLGFGLAHRRRALDPVVGGDAVLDLLAMISGVVERDDDLALRKSQFLGHGGNLGRLRAGTVAKRAEDPPHVGATGQGSAAPRRPRLEHDPGM
ncbi:MAG TPA: hypothetical protein VM142_07410 [Acidimicrobiales bacterium]|nr:hypothetical protein [Acidimicrobiales bacterium]